VKDLFLKDSQDLREDFSGSDEGAPLLCPAITHTRFLLCSARILWNPVQRAMGGGGSGGERGGFLAGRHVHRVNEERGQYGQKEGQW